MKSYKRKNAAKGLLDEKSNDEGGTTITENPTDIGGQRKQPKRKKRRR